MSIVMCYLCTLIDVNFLQRLLTDRPKDRQLYFYSSSGQLKTRRGSSVDCILSGPHRWSSTNIGNSQNLPIQQNCHKSWNSKAILMPFWDLEIPKNCNIVYFLTESTIFTVRAQWRRQEIFTKDDWVNEWINQSVTEVIVEQPLALPGSAKKL